MPKTEQFIREEVYLGPQFWEVQKHGAGKGLALLQAMAESRMRKQAPMEERKHGAAGCCSSHNN
jgi:hypothetical protein